jgi:hypothetical protein
MKTAFLAIAMLLYEGVAMAQSVEGYAGHQRAGVDLLWYKFMKNREGKSLPLLFFSRTRANTDYEDSPTAFGTTNAISYNFKSGWGIVAGGSFMNNGFRTKAGVQYVRQKGDFLFFGWLVADLKKAGNLDLFGLFRYQPQIKGAWRLFSQVELFPVYNPSAEIWYLTQRFRVGLKYHVWAAGWMMDFSQTGVNNFETMNNIGAFLRHDF